MGKTIFQDGKFVSVTLLKGVGSSAGNAHAVDGISGGTLTSNGVRDMIKSCLGDYLPFFDKIIKAQTQETPSTDQEPADSTNQEPKTVK